MSAPRNPLTNTDNNTSETTKSNQSKETESIDKEATKSIDIEESNSPNNDSTKSATKDNQNEDNVNEDKPKRKRCPHANHMKKKIKQFKTISCDKCHGKGGNDRLVLCLTCFKLNCARDSEHQHGLNHWVGNNKHNLAMSIPTFEEYSQYHKDIIFDMLSIWCYKCDLFLHETDQDKTQKVQQIKYEVRGCLDRGYKSAVKFNYHQWYLLSLHCNNIILAHLFLFTFIPFIN